MKWTRDKLRPEVEKWAASGHITADSARAILAGYPERGTGGWTTGFAVIGGILILGGISLVIASNWDSIPDKAKFGALLALQAAASVFAAEATARNWTRAGRETGSLLAAVLPLLALALISQTFHIEGKAANLFLAWTALIAPLPVVTRSMSAFAVFLTATMFSLGAASHDGLLGLHPGLAEICLLYGGFGVVCVAASSLWDLAGEPGLAGLGQYWGIITAMAAAYFLGFDFDLRHGEVFRPRGARKAPRKNHRRNGDRPGWPGPHPPPLRRREAMELTRRRSALPSAGDRR